MKIVEEHNLIIRLNRIANSNEILFSTFASIITHFINLTDFDKIFSSGLRNVEVEHAFYTIE